MSSDQGLKQGTVSFTDAIVIGLASTAPAYSLAAVIGSAAVIAGAKVPAILLASFIPMFLVASAFYYLNKVDSDCGTTFSWTTRALGPWAGWIAGWAVSSTGLLVVGSLADVGVRYFYVLIGADGAAASKPAVMIGAILLIIAMTYLCVVGMEASKWLQNGMIIAQVGALLLFALVAIVKVFGDSAPEGSIKPAASWIVPFGGDVGFSGLTAGLLLCVFAYWGWESAVNLSEESTDPNGAPGKAAVVSTLILLVTYIGVAFAVVAYAGLDRLGEFADDESLFSTLAADVLGSPWDKLVVLSIVTSAIASTQTTIIPASRTLLSMGRAGAMPESFAQIHARFLTPHVSTWIVGGIAIVYYTIVNSISENALFDTLTALSVVIAFYYGITGVACFWFYRKHLKHSLKNLLFVGIGPLIGAVLLAYLFVRSLIDMTDPANSYSGAWLGVGPPLVISLLIFGVGLIWMLIWRGRGPDRFWGRKPESASDAEAATALGMGGAE